MANKMSALALLPTDTAILPKAVSALVHIHSEGAEFSWVFFDFFLANMIGKKIV